MVVRNRLIQPLGIRGASLCRGGHHYVLRLDAPCSFLSSAPLGEGVLESRWVLSLEVTPDADISCPQQYLLERPKASAFLTMSRSSGCLPPCALGPPGMRPVGGRRDRCDAGNRRRLQRFQPEAEGR